MGGALIARLVQAGYAVQAYDPDPAAADRAKRQGATLFDSAAAVVERCRTLVLSLPSAREVRMSVDGLGEKLQPGDVIVDTTTGDPAQVETLAAELSLRGVQYIDATLGGSSSQIAAGEAIVICGAAQDAFLAVRSLLNCLGKLVFHTGPAGTGTRMKLVFNLAIGLHRAVLAEALEFARHSGISPSLALEILKAGAAYSRAMDAKGHKMLTSDYQPEARLAQHRKDVQSMIGSAAINGSFLPLTAAHQALLREAIDLGFGNDDNSAIIEVYRSRTR